MVVVHHTAEFAAWFLSLTLDERSDIDRVVALLAQFGVQLARPHSGSIDGTKTYTIRELRPCAGRSPLRVFYAFTPKRDAVVLVGGDKGKDKKMYVRLVPRAETLFAQFLKAAKEKK